jgi:hypothetical protein
VLYYVRSKDFEDATERKDEELSLRYYFIKQLKGLTNSSRNKYCKYRSQKSRYGGKDWYLE